MAEVCRGELLPFDGHRDWAFHEVGGGSWRGVSTRGEFKIRAVSFVKQRRFRWRRLGGSRTLIERAGVRRRCGTCRSWARTDEARAGDHAVMSRGRQAEGRAGKGRNLLRTR